MMKMLNCTAVAMILLAVGFSGAPGVMAAPSAESVKETVDYFYNGQEQGPILIDASLCQSVENLECTAQIDPASIGAGDTVNVLMQFFVPKGAVYDDIIVEYTHEGVPRRLTSHKIEGSIRYRVLNRYTLSKPGEWSITIKKGTQNLKIMDLNVLER
jgi:hypothetical protein